ncbi:MAG: uroporphyrinogen decarboxylase family protein, partial [Rhodospirillales bacterium]|nr:uroporphyrinogen decarboxylase family protein [Rhodospirillales bacterium]
MSKEKLKLWEQREARVQKALRCEPVDRVPFMFMGSGYIPRSMGVPLSKFCTDGELAVETTLDCLDSLDDIDGINLMVGGIYPANLASQWLSRIDVPGRQLPEDNMWQVHEDEDMKPEDYDLLLNEGWEAFIALMTPRIQDMELLKANQEWMAGHWAGLAGRYHERGFATLCGGIARIPFEVLCGARSMASFFVDCYRMPDKVEEALEVIRPELLKLPKQLTDRSRLKSMWIGGWRSASALLAPKIWDRFVFPHLKKLVLEMHKNDIFCVLHFDQNWDRDIERLLEFPRHACAFSGDGFTDLKR